MWSSHNNLVSRDSEPNSNLAPGAIAGIACGAGALFLGAAGLFILYWRRQRQFDREDNFYRSSTEENPHASAMAPAVSYTMDYKMSPQQHHREDAGSSYTYSPEKPTYGFSPLGTTETVGAAMPTHPAYIPRALVRGDLPPSSTHTRSASLASGGTQKQSPPLANRRQDNTFSFSFTPTFAVSDSLQQDPNTSSDSSLGGLPLTKLSSSSRQPTTSVPALVIPTFASSSPSAGSGYGSSSSNPNYPPHQAPAAVAPKPSGSKPRQYLPPRLNLSGTGSKPLQGKQNTTISGPLAFPEHYQPPPHVNQSGWQKQQQQRHAQAYDHDIDDDDYYYGEEDKDLHDDDFSQAPSSGDKRTFRDRSLSGGRGGYNHQDQRTKTTAVGGRNRSNSATPKQQQQGGFAGNRHYAEIEVGRDSDIW